MSENGISNVRLNGDSLSLFGDESIINGPIFIVDAASTSEDVAAVAASDIAAPVLPVRLRPALCDSTAPALRRVAVGRAFASCKSDGPAHSTPALLYAAREAWAAAAEARVVVAAAAQVARKATMCCCRRRTSRDSR